MNKEVLKGHVVNGLLVGLVIAGPAMAQTTDTIDVSGPLATIAAGAVAYALIGPAKTGLKYLKMVWNKM